MKCNYYLAPDLDITRNIRDELRDIGIGDWYIHVHSRDTDVARLHRRKIHSSNFIERSDALAGGVTGATIGLVLGLLIALALLVARPVQLSGFVYVIIILAPAVFGFWQASLVRAKYESAKVKPFHDQIEAGKFLVLIYTPNDKDESLKQMMREKYPNVEHVAVDEHFANPLRRPRPRS